jgi:hypothetical protein
MAFAMQALPKHKLTAARMAPGCGGIDARNKVDGKASSRAHRYPGFLAPLFLSLFCVFT